MKTTKGTKLILAITLALFSCNLLSAQVVRRVPSRQVVRQSQLIRIRNAGDIIRSDAYVKNPRQEYTLEGYFVSDPVPMLLTDMKWYEANTPMPDSVFIPIEGSIKETLMKNRERYFGAYIRIEGSLTVEKRRTLRGEVNEAVIVGKKTPTIIRQRPSATTLPQLYNLCKINPKLCTVAPFLSKDFALLYSGGINSYNAKSRYWNDLKFMYKTLKSKYGYSEDQIVVVYKDGVAADAEMTVDYPASKTGLANALTYLRGKVGIASDLFVFITNHGGGYNTSDNTNYSGNADAAPKDEVDTYEIDETVFYYNEANNRIPDDTLAVFLNSISGKLVAVLEPCFSGGLIRDLRGSDHIIISAANEFQFSWSGGPGNHDMFSYYFTCALNGADHTGVAVNADTNGDSKVSILEAFIYARDHDTADEEPLLEDSGNGVGSHNPSATGTDGPAASVKFL